MIAALVAGVVALELRSPLAIAVGGLASLATACAATLSAAFFYRRVRIDEKIVVTCVAITQALLFTGVASVLSYLLAREGGPLWDPTLQSWDKSIGFDWLAYVHFVDARGWLVLPYRLAYASLIPQVIVVIIALGLRGRVYQLRVFLAAMIGSGFVAVLLSPMFTAVGNYVYLGIEPSELQRIDPWAGYVHLNDLTTLRTGQMRLLELPKMQGIITFPSYHSCLAALTMWAFWKSGLGWLRWAGLAVALLTILATPIDGGHYLVDVMAGIAIALAAIAAATRLVFFRFGVAPARKEHERELSAATGR